MIGFITEPPRRSNANLIDKIRLVRGDLTKQADINALVSTIPITLDCDGSLNESLMEAAGEQLDQFILENIMKPRLGDVFAAPGFDLPVDHVIYTIKPDWRDDFAQEDRDLLRCYRHPMKLAKQRSLKTIAFPALGTGEKSFPLKRAIRLAVRGIMEEVNGTFEEVRIVCDKDETCNAFLKRLKRLGWKGEVN